VLSGMFEGPYLTTGIYAYIYIIACAVRLVECYEGSTLVCNLNDNMMKSGDLERR